MVGLDAAGKTTILYKLKLGEGEFFRPFTLYHVHRHLHGKKRAAAVEILLTLLSHIVSF